MALVCSTNRNCERRLNYYIVSLFRCKVHHRFEALTLVLLTFRNGTGFFATSVSTEFVIVDIEFREETLLDEVERDEIERNGLHRLPRAFSRLNTFIADASGGGV